MKLDELLIEIEKLKQLHEWLVVLTPYLNPEWKQINGRNIWDDIVVNIHNHVKNHYNIYINYKRDDFVNIGNFVKEINYLKKSKQLLNNFCSYLTPRICEVNGIEIEFLPELYLFNSKLGDL